MTDRPPVLRWQTALLSAADPYAGSRRSGDDGRNYAAGQSAAHRRIKGKDSGGKDCWNQDSIGARKEPSGR